VPTFFFSKPEHMRVFRVQYELNASGKPLLDKDGKPKIKYEYYKTGKKKGKIVKDENGRSVPIYAKDNKGRCIPEWSYSKAYVIDPKTKKIKFAIDPKNKTTKLDPKTGKPVLWIRSYKTPRSFYDLKKDEKAIAPKRSYIRVAKRNSKGEVVSRTTFITKMVPKVDKKGKAVKVPKVDKKGKAEKDKKGKVVWVAKMVPKKVAVSTIVKERALMTDALWERCYLPWWYRKFFPYKKKISLGLDLQGGTHLVMNVDVKKALSNKASSLARDLYWH